MKPLTSRELEILQLIVRKGYDPKAHRSKLGIQYSTWKHHLSVIYAKLSVDNIVDAVIAAIRTGIVDLGLDDFLVQDGPLKCPETSVSAGTEHPPSCREM